MAQSRRKRPAEVKEEVSQAVTEDAVTIDWPLGKDDYFYLPAVSRAVHSGQGDEDRVYIGIIQQAVSAPVTGIYDEATAAAVSAWRGAHGLPLSGLVDADVWAQLVGE